MYIIIYKFHVGVGFEYDFEIAWANLTEAFMAYSGGLGSRLHKDKEGTYIAYAQWPNRETWETARRKFPKNAERLFNAMDQSCTGTEILYQLDVVSDMLKI